MSHKNKESLTYQITENLKSKLAIGESKADAKIAPAGGDRMQADVKIYSWSTFRTYEKHCNYFTNYCKAEHHCRTLAECRPYVDEYLQSRIDAGLSPYTVKLEVSALAKLYDTTSRVITGTHGQRTEQITDMETPPRVRSEITRSRGEAVRDKHFSEKNNADLVTFCKSTGLRRAELQMVTGADVQYHDGRLCVHVVKGKGGRERWAPVVGDVGKVLELKNAAGDGKIFEKIHSAADVHSYRADYAKAVYDAYKRPLDGLSHKDKYYGRGEQKGVVYDRQAMLEASQALGHNRITVVGEHYLR